MQAQTARQEILRLAEQARTVSDEVECLSVRERLSDLDTLLTELPIALGRVRERGYEYRGDLEGRVQGLRRRWPEVTKVAGAEMERRVQSLRPAMERAEEAVHDLEECADQPLDSVLSAILRAQDQLTRLHEESAEVHSRIVRVFAPLEGEAHALADEVRGCLRLLDARDAASFSLEPDERLVEAADATWLPEPSGEHRGVLFLTDRRLLFERREEMPGRRRLFARRPPVYVQEVAWEAPVADLDMGEGGDVTHAIALRKDLLVLRFRAAGASREFVLRLDDAAPAWREQIARVYTGDIGRDLVAGPSQRRA